MRLVGLLLSAFLMLSLGSCTTNNGDIGEFFGEWAVDDVTVDGVRVDDYPYGLTYWRFQADLLSVILEVNPHGDNKGYVATWREEGDYLVVDFDQMLNSHTPFGKIPPELLIPPQRETWMRILEKKSRTLKFSFDNDDGQPVVFTLRKII